MLASVMDPSELQELGLTNAKVARHLCELIMQLAVVGEQEAAPTKKEEARLVEDNTNTNTNTNTTAVTLTLQETRRR